MATLTWQTNLDRRRNLKQTVFYRHVYSQLKHTNWLNVVVCVLSSIIIILFIRTYQIDLRVHEKVHA